MAFAEGGCGRGLELSSRLGIQIIRDTWPWVQPWENVVTIALDGKKKYVKTWAKRVQQFTRCTRSKSKAFKASKKAMAFP